MLSLKQIAETVGGEVLGDENFMVTKLASLKSATEYCLSFCYYPYTYSVSLLQQTKAGAVLLSAENADLFSEHKIIVDKPRLAYAKISRFFKEPINNSVANAASRQQVQISSQAEVADDVVLGYGSVIEAGAKIASKVSLGDHVHIGRNVTINQATIIEHQVVIHTDSQIGANCHISSGVVIGSSGFGYEYDERENQWCKIEHLGAVVIGDDVDIGANTTIDRGALDNTVIADGVKLDNQIQVGHNVVIGNNTIIAGCAGIAGSSSIGSRCKIGGRVTVSDHVHITDDVTILIGGQVIQNIDKAGVYSSVLPVQSHISWKKNLAKFKKLYLR